MFNELTDFVLGAGFNLAVALLIVRFIYYPFTQNKNYVFTFLAFSTIIYFVLGLFTSIDLSVGVGFGLFAIFSVLRYRTDEMPIREMTYLFIIIALPVMNSILMSNGEVMKLLVANGVIVALLYVLEKEWGFHFETSKKIIALLLASTLIFILTACSGDTSEFTDPVYASQPVNGSGTESITAVDLKQNSEITPVTISVEYNSDDLDSSVSTADMSYIEFEGSSITFAGSGATVNDNIITITSAGMYSISGNLDDGQIIVNTEDKETVRLVLNGVDIACSTSTPIYVINAEKTVITLADGTENYVTDGDSYIFEDTESDEPNAAVFSKDDLTINGNGSLTVNANYNNGITSKDDLKITGGNIIVNAVNDGIKGKDSIAVKDGIITVNAGGDGMQSHNDEDPEKGYVSIEDGTLNITAGADGIQAATGILIEDGNITISSGGGSINSSDKNDWGMWGKKNDSNESSDDNSDAVSAKGIKAAVDVTIENGTINIDSSDDSIHSNSSLRINGGNITLTSGDDGIHSDSTLEINGGELNITKSYEGIESAILTFNEGNIHLVASDDGINAAGGNDGSSMNGRPGQNNFNASMDYHTYINGGYIFIEARGDGIDSNGLIDMTGGVALVNGPTSNGNGALDYAGAFNITGGFFVAAGSSGMAQAPSTSSTQYSVMHNFASVQTAGTMVHIESEDGEEILTFVPTKEYQSVVFSSPELENEVTYIVYTGGNSTGTVIDGLYSDGTYIAGTEITSFTISSIVTGARGGGPGGGGPRGGPGGGRVGDPGGEGRNIRPPGP
jgi:hypothetical protein